MAARLVTLAFAILSAANASPVTIRDIVTVDCNSVVHLFTNTPLETHINVPVLSTVFNTWTRESRARAQCLRDAQCPSMTNATIDSLYTISPAMLFNLLAPITSKVQRPASCASAAGFASGFWSDSPILGAMSTSLALPPTCSYASYYNGQGCTLSFTEPVSGVQANLAAARCPGSELPYISLSVSSSTWANFGMRPCSTLGSSGECGGTPAGGAPLVCRTFTTDPNELWSVLLRAVGLVGSNPAADMAGCNNASAPGGLSAQQVLTRSLRTYAYSAWGLPPPAATDGAPLAFCLPSNTTLTAVSNWITGPASATTQTPLYSVPGLPAAAGANAAACEANRCFLASVGDGTCNIECFSAACRWDGGDCGHSPAVWPPVVTTSGGAGSSVQYSVRLTLAEAGLAGVTSPPASLALNPWEDCNGIGSPYNIGGGMACNCALFQQRPMLPNVTVPGPKCQGYMPGAWCQWRSPLNNYIVGWCNGEGVPPGSTLLNVWGPGGSTPSSSTNYSVNYGLTGVGAAMSAWDGTLADGTNALSPDRLSGAIWPTPALLTDVGETSVPASWQQLLAFTCGGDLSLRLGNDALALAVNMPLLKTAPAALYSFVQAVASCRARTLGVPPLSDAQFEARFGVSHGALWMYQETALTPATLDMYWAGVPGAGGGFGPRNLSDWLMAPREPAGASPSQPTLRSSAWGTWGRVAPPTAGCSFDTVSLGGSSAQGPAGALDRRCRLQYVQLGSALSVAGGAITPFNLNFEARQDTCGSAQLGVNNGWLGATAIDSTGAAASMPSFALYADSALTSVFSAPVLCATDTDCLFVGGGNLLCYDLIGQLASGGSMAASLPPRLQDVFAMFSAGLNTDGTAPATCASAGRFQLSLRSLLKTVGGALAPGLVDNGNNDLKVCLPPLNGVGEGIGSWASAAYTPCSGGGSCLLLPPDPANGLGLSLPGVVTGMAPFPTAVPANAHAAPDSPDGLAAPFSPDARPVPSGQAASFTVSLRPASPALYAAALAGGLSNDVKSKLRRVLVAGLGSRGYAVTTEGVFVTGSAPTPGGAAGMVDLAFSVALAPGTPAATLSAMSAELTTGVLGGMAGSVFAMYGVVLASDASTVIIRAGGSVTPATRTTTGTPSSSLGASPTPTASCTPSATPSASPFLSYINVMLNITVVGVNASVATDPRVWGVIRASIACSANVSVGAQNVMLRVSRDGRTGTVASYAAGTGPNALAPGAGGCGSTLRRALLGAEAATLWGRALQPSFTDSALLVIAVTVPPGSAPPSLAAQAAQNAQVAAVSQPFRVAGASVTAAIGGSAFTAAAGSVGGVSPASVSAVAASAATVWVDPSAGIGGAPSGGGGGGGDSALGAALGAVGGIVALGAIAFLVLRHQRQAKTRGMISAGVRSKESPAAPLHDSGASAAAAAAAGARATSQQRAGHRQQPRSGVGASMNRLGAAPAKARGSGGGAALREGDFSSSTVNPVVFAGAGKAARADY